MVANYGDMTSYEKTPEVPGDFRNSKSEICQAQKRLVSTIEHMQVPNGTGPGVWRSKRPLNNIQLLFDLFRVMFNVYHDYWAGFMRVVLPNLERIILKVMFSYTDFTINCKNQIYFWNTLIDLGTLLSLCIQ